MEANRVSKFYIENKDKFTSKRQASKYLNQYGNVWKTEQMIPLSYSKRTMVENPQPIKSDKYKNKLKKKK